MFLRFYWGELFYLRIEFPDACFYVDVCQMTSINICIERFCVFTSSLSWISIPYECNTTFIYIIIDVYLLKTVDSVMDDRFERAKEEY